MELRPNHLISFPSLKELKFDQVSLFYNWTVSDLFQVFDLIIGHCEHFSFIEGGRAASAFCLLTHLHPNSVYSFPLKSINRIENAIKHFLLNSRIENEYFNTVHEWNLSFPPFVSCFISVFAAEMDSAILQLIMAALNIYGPFMSCRSNLWHLLVQIYSLTPSRLDPIKNLSFIHNLIAKILKFAVQELNHQPGICGPNPNNTALINLPVVIDFLMQEIEGWPDFFDIEGIPEIFDQNGSINYFIYWLLAHNSKLFSSITPEMVSIPSTICPLFSFEAFLFPHYMNYRIKTSSFQKSLFSHVKDPKLIVKFILKNNPRNNLHQLQSFFDTFRAETDFQLISNLSEFEHNKRYVIIDIEYATSHDYIYASVFNHNSEDPERSCYGYCTNYVKTHVAKIILAILSE